MQPEDITVERYLASLDDDRRPTMTALIRVIDENLPDGFERTMQSGMPSWVVPLADYPAGYHCTPDTPLPFLAVASQKRHIAVYHMGIYADPGLLDWFIGEYGALATGRKLDMGKSCIRFRKPEHVPLELIGRLAAKVTPGQWIGAYERGRAQGRPGTGVREPRA